MTYLDLHPEHGGNRYTLRGLFRSQEQAESKADQLEKAGFEIYVFEEDAPNGHWIFGVAARHRVNPVARAGMPHQHTADWTVTRAANNLFRRIMRAAKKKGTHRWYKPLDIQLLHRCIQRLDWTGTHLDVAAGVISDIILAHPFPNANHRTSIHLAREYLQTCGIQWPYYTLRGRGADQLHRDTKDFFIESKYLLQIYRHPEMLKKAYESGYRHLRIGPASIAEINPKDLDLSKDLLKRRHIAAARKLIRNLAQGENLQRLESPRTKGLREWAQTISG